MTAPRPQPLRRPQRLRRRLALPAAVVIGLLGLGGGWSTPGLAQPAAAEPRDVPASTGAPAEATTTATPTLIAIRATRQGDVDRLSFEFSGGQPGRHDVRYVPEVIADPSGKPVPLRGHAFLQVSFAPARGHDDNGNSTYGPPRRTFALPNLIEVANAGDFEAVLSFGVGLARRAPFHVSTPQNRVVIDIQATAGVDRKVR